MSSGNSYPRCAIELRPSRALSLYAFLLTVIAVAAPWFAGVPPVFALAASLAAMPAGLQLFRWAHGEVQRFAWQSDGRWVLIDAKGGQHEEARLLRGILVGSRVLALRWQCPSCRKRFRVTLLADNCNEDAFRRLAVRLRLMGDEELFGQKVKS